MKKINAVFFIGVAALTVGCTTYPKTYTYSPTVTINGSDERASSPSSPLILPNPFAKTPRKLTEYTINNNHKYEHVSPLTTPVPQPPVSVNYYPADFSPTYVFLGSEHLQGQ